MADSWLIYGECSTIQENARRLLDTLAFLRQSKIQDSTLLGTWHGTVFSKALHRGQGSV